MFFSLIYFLFSKLYFCLFCFFFHVWMICLILNLLNYAHCVSLHLTCIYACVACVTHVHSFLIFKSDAFSCLMYLIYASLKPYLSALWALFVLLEISLRGLFEKWSTLDPKKFYAIPFQKLVFLISLYPEFLEKKQRNTKKVDFWSVLGVFVLPSMLI